MDRITLEYQQFLDTLSDAERSALSDFFSGFDLNFTISGRDRRRIREDFEFAFMALYDRGVSIEEAKSRLALSNLGGFYARQSIMWFPLDDAAKIYPISMGHGVQNLFRLSVYFKEDVVPEVLQMALTFTIKRFPGFATTLKKGFFWHYLDTVKKRFSLVEENDVPCQAMKISLSGSCSFRLVYYRNRVSAEFFHVLTDGTGGMVFLKAIAAEYLRILHGVVPSPDEESDLWDVNETPMLEEFENAFVKLERAKSSGGFIQRSAVQMSGALELRRPCRILHFKMPTEKLREAAKKIGSTVTVYLLSKMFLACSAATEELAGDISIQLPVNMRKFYPTRTIRNFSMYCGIRLPVSEISERINLSEQIAQQIAEKAAEEPMHEMITSAVKLVSALRLIPLAIKQPVAKMVYGFLGDKTCTTTFSNLGLANMPESLSKYIESMDFCLGAPENNRLAVAAISFGGVTTFSITKNTADPTFEEKMLKYLTDDGIDVTVEGSAFYER